MRTVLAGFLFVLIAFGAFAQGNLNAEITAILDRNAQTPLGTMTVGDLEKLQGEISIVIQKEEYVQRIRRASFVLPGLGQLRTGDTTGGALFLAGDVALTAGTLLGAYFLLPSNVRSLSPLNTPLSEVRSTWESNTLADYAPSAAVAMGGMAAGMVLRWISARNAESEAREAVSSGKVTFQPVLIPLLDMDGRPGIGVRMRMR